MSTDTTELEKSIVSAIIDEHVEQHPMLRQLLPFLVVKSREVTGVGAYIVFDKSAQPVGIQPEQAQLGFSGEISVPNVPSGLGAVLDIEDGKLNHLELFTYGDELWNGSTEFGHVLQDQD